MASSKTIKSAGDFGLVVATQEDVSALRRGGGQSKYPALVDAFIANSLPGDIMEVKNLDGTELDTAQVKRMYNGIRNFLRYRDQGGDPLPVSVHRASNRLFITNEQG